MGVSEIPYEDWLWMCFRLQDYQRILEEILNILEAEHITARGSMYQKGRHDLAKKIYSRIEKEIER